MNMAFNKTSTSGGMNSASFAVQVKTRLSKPRAGRFSKDGYLSKLL